MTSSIGRAADIARNLVYLKLYKKTGRIYSDTAYSDLCALYLLARDGWGSGAIVEIGAFHGKSTVFLALGSSARGREKVISIDPHTLGSKKIFLDNIRMMGVESCVTPMVTTSEEARKIFNSPARLIFIDGDHSYESVKKDIDLWAGLLIKGGVMVFHDLNWEGVFKALEEFLGRQAEFIIEGTVGCSLIVSKEASMNKGVLEEIRLFNRAKRMLRPWKKVPAEEALAEEMLRRVNGLRAKYQRPGDEK